MYNVHASWLTLLCVAPWVLKICCSIITYIVLLHNDEYVIAPEGNTYVPDYIVSKQKDMMILLCNKRSKEILIVN